MNTPKSRGRGRSARHGAGRRLAGLFLAAGPSCSRMRFAVWPRRGCDGVVRPAADHAAVKQDGICSAAAAVVGKKDGRRKGGVPMIFAPQPMSCSQDAVLAVLLRVDNGVRHEQVTVLGRHADIGLVRRGGYAVPASGVASPVTRGSGGGPPTRRDGFGGVSGHNKPAFVVPTSRRRSARWSSAACGSSSGFWKLRGKWTWMSQIRCIR